MSNNNTSIHDFDFSFICNYFKLLKRQGPGSPEATRKATMAFKPNPWPHTADCFMKTTWITNPDRCDQENGVPCFPNSKSGTRNLLWEGKATSFFLF